MTFEYDIAFSFLKDDEPTAAHLADLLADRYKAFVYSKRQGELVGTDGQETFNLVFGEQARTVVVLYRDGWGTTPWTRIEQTAIQNRALAEGWDFLLFIKLAAAAVTPKWLVRSYIWQDFEKGGPAEAAGAISALVQRAGGAPRIESLDEKADRISRDIAFEQRRKRFICSEESVRAGQNAIAELASLLKDHAARLKLNVLASPIANEIGVGSQHASMMVHWHCRYSNTTENDSSLEVTYWAGHPPLWGVRYYDQGPPKLGARQYKIDMNRSEEPVWQLKGSAKVRALAVPTLADEILGELLEQGRKIVRG